MAEIIVAPNSTQRLVDVEEIKNGVITLKNGGLRAVIMVSGVNFELKSEEEQDLITNAYQDFLNALDFSVQIIIHSRKLNIDIYLKKLEKIKEREENQLLRNQIDEYVQFIRGFVKENDIMTKTFFVVVPYDAVNIKEIQKGFLSFIPFFSKKRDDKKEKEETNEYRAQQLSQRVDEVLSGVERIGLRAVVLNDGEILEFYYNLYNPETVEKEMSRTSSENHKTKS